MKTKSLPKTFLTFFVLVFALFGIVKPANAVIHELPIGNNTVYFSITDNTNHYVEYVCPNQNNVSWDGYTMPTGILNLLGTFEYMGVTYTATAIGNAAFNGCSGLYAVTIPSTVTHIYTNAFRNTSLLQVNIYSNAIASDYYTPNSNLHTIFGNAESYNFGQGVTAISNCALYGSSNVTTVTLASTITSIGYSAFSGCSSLEQVTIPNGVTTIPSSAFNGCSSLEQITIPSSVTSIKDYAFQGCNNLHRINITDMAAWCRIDYELFSFSFEPYDLYLNGTKVTNLTIPNGVTSINNYAFFNCTGLTSVTFPSTLTSIQSNAFAYCTGLTQVTFTSSVSSIASDAFSNCTGLNRVNISSLDAWCMNNFYSADANPLTMAHHLYLNGTKVTNLNSLSNATTSIGSYAFSGCTDFTELTIAGSVTSIRSNAFINCSNMTSVTIPSSVTAIGSSAFEGCFGLNRVNVSNIVAWCGISFADAHANPLYYAHHIYHNGNLVTNLNYGTSTSIGDYAFIRCYDFVSSPNLTSSSIGSYAFSGCPSITSVTIPSVVQSVGNHAFDECPHLTSVTIKSNAVASARYRYYSSYYSNNYDNFLTRFGNHVTSYTLGPYVTAIGENAFNHCTGMTEITFLGSVSSVGDDAFKDCTGLTRVNISDLDAWCGVSFNYTNANPLYYAHHLYHNTSLVTSLDNLSTATSIGDYTFYGCTDLTSVTIPSTVQSIGNRAFDGCANLTSVTINSNAVTSAPYSYSSSYGSPTYDNFRSRFGNGVTSYTIGPEVTAISACAFYNCDGITELTVCAVTPPTITSTTFWDVSTSIPVYVPLGTVAAYQAAQYWSRFTNFIGSTSFNSTIVPIPYTELFPTDNTPEGWSTCSGALNWSNSSSTYTNVTLMPNTTAWQFGTKNGVFNSHAYAKIGATSQDYKWLISPPISLGDENDVFLSFGLAMSRETGTQVPITPGAQDDQYIAVLVTNNNGGTWYPLGEWREVNGYMNLDALNPEGNTFYFDLSAYQNQIVQVAFYAECTDGTDNCNHVHIDNVGIQSYNMSAPPVSVTVSDIGLYTAKVLWTPAYPMQNEWDVCVCAANLTTPSGTIAHRQGHQYYNVEGLSASTQYKAWVRYHSGNTTSSWTCSAVFETAAPATIPFAETFDTNSAPDGWATYLGALNYNGNNVYTATLTPNTNYTWSFGEQNGVYDSHAYATLGNSSGNERRWLVSPLINFGNANDVFLSFDLGMTRETGNQVPITPGEQDHQFIAVLITNDSGATWHALAGWCGEMSGWPDLNYLNPEDGTHYCSLDGYQNQNIQVAFYAECTNSGDANNHVHIDNVGINSHDLSAPPVLVTVSEVAGHSAKVSWTPASPMQYHWDMAVCASGYNQPPTNLIQHRDGYLWYEATGLVPDFYYEAWVRYNDGSTTSSWVKSNVFHTVPLCAAPTNIQVTTTTHTIFVSWEPGQSNQTSWTVNIWGSDEWGYPTTETSIEIDATGMLEPGETFLVSVTGYCTDGDGDITSDWVQPNPQMQDYPTLTVSEGQDWSSEVVIQMDNLGYNESWSQFIIPSEMLTDMQYSTINQLRFVCDKGYTEWNNEEFSVYLKEVDFDDLESFCGDAFYEGEMSLFYQGTLSVGTNHIMAIDASWDGNLFYYHDKNLLVSIQQDTDDQNTQDPQFAWAGTNISDNVALAPEWHDIPYCVTFLPNTTFRYETDTYLPPTDFEAYITGGYEVTYTWTPRPGQIGIDIMVGRNPQFNGDYMTYENLDDDFFVAYDELFYQPETTYYYRCRGVYYENGEYHRSVWSTTGSFTTPDACEPPANLTVSDVGPFSAQLSWVSGGEYDEVIYRELNTQWEEGFEGGAMPSGWTRIANGGYNYGNWTVITMSNNNAPHTGTYQIRSGGAMNSNNQTTTDNWLVLPQLELGGVLKLWSRTTMGLSQSFSVYVSTTGSNVADFGAEPIFTGSSMDYQEFTISLSGYSGSGYVAIRHQYNGHNGVLAIDDVSYHYGGGWTYAGIVEGGQYLINDLTPGATYQARVSAMCETGYASSWTPPVIFSTPYNIVFEDEGVESICLGIWDTDHNSYLSYAEAAAVQDLDGAFEEQDGITSFNELQYFTGLTTIGPNAFSGCTSLSAITLPNTVTLINSYAFGTCTSLQSIVIPPSVNTIEGAAFYNCGITEVDLPYSVTTIGTMAFSECDNLVSVYIPASVTAISNGNSNAFTGAALANIEVDACNPVYDSRNGCNAIIETATNKLITGCQNTIIPYGVTSIGNSAFEDCSNLTDITLPATMETLGDYAFLNCTSLNTIEVNSTTPPTMNTTQTNHTFKDLDISNISVYVPCGSLETYQNSYWSGFDLVENCNIVFEDNLTKELCVNAWDLNFDGELSYREAAAVTSLNNEFYESNIIRFNELQYFTGLTSIGEEDFGDCERLVAVTLPPTVTQIYNYAFENCTSLTSITFGENIGTIWDYAFSGCEGLWFIKVEAQNPPAVGYNAFNDVDGDIPVYVPCGTLSAYQNASGWNGFTNIIDMCDNIEFADATVKTLCVANWDGNNDGELSYGEAATVTSLNLKFNGRTDITWFNELQYFTGLSMIEAQDFFGCTVLTEVTLPPHITAIGTGAFYGCTHLENVVIPSTVTTLHSQAFYGTGITEVVVPNSVTLMGNSVFGNCSNLTTASLPASVLTISSNPFEYCAALTTITVDPANPVFYDSNCNAIIRRDNKKLISGCGNTIIPDDVTALGNYAFSGQTALTSITIPSTVVEMGNGVFNNCSGLTEIYIWAVTPPTMGYNVFEGVNTDDVWVYVPCGSLGYYDDDESWSVFNNIFGDCNIVFADDDVRDICVANWDTNGDGGLSFSEAAAVTTLNPLGESNSSVFMGKNTMNTFNELQYFTGLTNIEQVAFNGCRFLTSITLPHTITAIETSAFGGCNRLSSINLPENLISIGNVAFQGCTSLTSITIPASVTSIGQNPFRDCSALESITVESDNPKYDSRDNCNAIIYPSTQNSQIVIYLISGCKNTVIPEGVTAINTYAFDGCTEMTTLTLPSSVNYIYNAAFKNCTGLQSITVMATTPPTYGNGAFQNVPTDIPVYVPCGTKAAYQAAIGWSNFTNIQADCAEVTQSVQLSAGWNWFSTYIEVEDPITMLQMLETALGENGVAIKSSDFTTEYDSEWGWFGDLDDEGIVNEQMYKVEVLESCTLSLEGMPANPASHPITINPGWNWIGFPSAVAMSLDDAFASFAQEGDMIRNNNYEIEYDPEWGWFGDFETLEPGQGYMYYSSSNVPRTLIFPAGAK